MMIERVPGSKFQVPSQLEHINNRALRCEKSFNAVQPLSGCSAVRASQPLPQGAAEFMGIGVTGYGGKFLSLDHAVAWGDKGEGGSIQSL